MGWGWRRVGEGAGNRREYDWQTWREGKNGDVDLFS